jgi:hypothetical protein
VREIRTLRAMWRALETEPRQVLNGHEEGNLGHKPRRSLRAAAPALDPTSSNVWNLFAQMPNIQKHTWFFLAFQSCSSGLFTAG